MGKNIHTIDSHVTYRKGELTTGTPSKGRVACGPGTAYPVPATLDQIAEIFYRVRNTEMSGGEYTAEHATYPEYNLKYEGLFNTGSIPAHNYHIDDSGGWQQDVRRGYSFYESSTNKGWLKHHCDPVYTSPIGGDFHDAKDEFCMWPDDGVYVGTRGANHFAGTYSPYSSESAPSVYGPYYKRIYPQPDPTPDEITYRGDSSSFGFSPQVAFIGAVSPFDPAATLYPAISWSNSTWNFNSTFGSEASNGSAEIVLSSSTLLIPIRLYIPAYTTALTSSPRLTVTEWWPYAKPDGSPVWNAATGLSV